MLLPLIAPFLCAASPNAEMRFNSATKLLFRLFIIVSSSLTAIFRVEKSLFISVWSARREIIIVFPDISLWLPHPSHHHTHPSLPYIAAIISPVFSSPLTEKKEERYFFIFINIQHQQLLKPLWLTLELRFLIMLMVTENLPDALQPQQQPHWDTCCWVFRVGFGWVVGDECEAMKIIPLSTRQRQE